MKSAAFLGDVGIDAFGGEDRLGGCALHAARSAAKAGPALEVQLVSAVGTDAPGARIIGELGALGALVRQVAGKTPVQKVRILAGGDRELCGYDAGILPAWRPDAAQRAAVAAADVVHTVAFAQILPLFSHVLALPRRGKLFVDFMDLSDFGRDARLLAPYWDGIDGAFLGLAPGDDLSALRRPGKTVIVTLGAHGSVCFDDGRTFECAAEPVASIRDTTGAGDTYAGAFLAHVVNGAAVPDAMRQASAAAARFITSSSPGSLS